MKVLIMTMVLTSLLVAQKEALIVGVSDYQGTQSDLRGIEIDVNNMKALFEKWGFNVTVLFDKESMKIDEYLQKYHSLGKDDAFLYTIVVMVHTEMMIVVMRKMVEMRRLCLVMG